MKISRTVLPQSSLLRHWWSFASAWADWKMPSGSHLRGLLSARNSPLWRGFGHEKTSPSDSSSFKRGKSQKTHSAIPPRSGILRTQKLKIRLLRTQSWKVLPLKCGVGHNKAVHSLKPLPSFSRVSCRQRPLRVFAEANAVPVSAHRINRSPCSSQTIEAVSRVECSWNINRLQNTCHCAL